MKKLPACPMDGQNELHLWRGGDRFEVNCLSCGWTTGLVTLATGEDLHEVIAAKVAAAKEASAEVDK